MQAYIEEAVIADASVGFDPETGDLTELRFTVTITNHGAATICIQEAERIKGIVREGGIRVPGWLNSRYAAVYGTPGMATFLGLTEHGGLDRLTFPRAARLAAEQGVKDAIVHLSVNSSVGVEA